MTKIHHPSDRGSRRKTKRKKEIIPFDKSSKEERSSRIQKKLAKESAALTEHENAIQEWTTRAFTVD